MGSKSAKIFNLNEEENMGNEKKENVANKVSPNKLKAI